MTVINIILGFAGFFGWLWVWTRAHYQTGATLRVQIGIAAIGLAWLMLIMADLVQHLQPTGGTVAARAVVLVGLWCLKPLLEKTKNA